MTIEVNKIIAAVLLVALIVIGIGKISDMAFHVNKPENSAYKVELEKNNSIEKQASEVKSVKKYESGIVRDPVTISSTNSIEELKNLTNELSISGMPVVDNGQLKGIVTGRDFRYAENMDSNVSTIMTPFEKLVTVNEGFSQGDVMQLMYKNRIEKATQ